MLEVVNLLAGGNLDQELELQELLSVAEEFDKIQAKYDPTSSSALQIQFRNNKSKFMIYRTGSFVVTGMQNREELEEAVLELQKWLKNIGVIQNEDIVDTEVYNRVFTDDLDTDLDLSEFALYLGLTHTEYEPEQSPFLVYRPPEIEGVVTIANTGKIVVNGIRKRDQAERVVAQVKREVSGFSNG
jgi:transcription initiation factor TFIID TATA-box-binding protein